ncbi:hypothetical protein L3X38_041652 [Prunus dulcis]|uniref:Uncharacterized protein n=1 Tax=Prunus dulcis TaxID=3755 RepID=A0AAD4UTF6_PRUDU|nr:hypothetical protein L3X38_041652 [Prunus dulcis]
MKSLSISFYNKYSVSYYVDTCLEMSVKPLLSYAYSSRSWMPNEQNGHQYTTLQEGSRTPILGKGSTLLVWIDQDQRKRSQPRISLSLSLSFPLTLSVRFFEYFVPKAETSGFI